MEVTIGDTKYWQHNYPYAYYLSRTGNDMLVVMLMVVTGTAPIIAFPRPRVRVRASMKLHKTIHLLLFFQHIKQLIHHLHQPNLQSKCLDHAAEHAQPPGQQLHLLGQHSNRLVRPLQQHTHLKPNSIHLSKANKGEAQASSARWLVQPRKPFTHSPFPHPHH